MKTNNKKIDEFLLSALALEDHMSKDVYNEFLDKNTWPDALPENVFKNIKNFLDTIIKETENHKKIFLDLKNRPTL